MSSDYAIHQEITKLNPDQTIFQSCKGNSKTISIESTNLQELSQDLRYESALLALMMLLQESRKFISVKNSILAFKHEAMDVLVKFNFLMEVICHIPFTFEFNVSTREFQYDFGHLSHEIQKILAISF